MTERYPLFYRFIHSAGLLLIALAMLFPAWTQSLQLFPALALIVLGGIPHGATDYLIFRHLSRPLLGTRTMTQFYVHYLLLILAYSAIWFLSPVLALSIFLILSMFHFGQSNWNYVQWNSKSESLAVNTLWGAFVVLTPIIWHYQEARLIIEKIIGFSPVPLSLNWRFFLCLSLLIANLWMVVTVRWQRRINARNFRSELINIAVLSAVFYSLPLLLGFAVYFVFWHSFSSMLDQIRFFQAQRSAYTWRQYLRNTLPFTLVAILGLAGLIYGQAQLGLNASIGMLFIFISVVTLPHMILIDRLYEEWKLRDTAAT